MIVATLVVEETRGSTLLVDEGQTFQQLMDYVPLLLQC